MQNEKQTKLFKDHENLIFFRKKVDQQTKGTHPRKMFAQSRKYSVKMNNLKRKKSVKQEEKAPTKRFSYCLRGQKPQDQKIQKFLPHLISVGGVSNKKRKKSCCSFLALRSKVSGLGLCFVVA